MGSDWFSLNLCSQLSVCFRDRGRNGSHAQQMWAGIKAAEGGCTRQQQLPKQKVGISNDLPGVMYVHIRKLNLTKRMSNKAINSISGSSGCNFCLQSFLSRKTAAGPAPAFAWGSLVRELWHSTHSFPTQVLECLLPTS